MSTPDDANDERFDPEIDAPTEAAPTESDPSQPESVSADSDDGDDRDDDDLDVVDVRLGPNDTPTTTDTLQQDGEDAGAFDPSVDQPETPFIESPPTTLPILDEDGNIPEFLDGVARGLELWEEAAAEVPGDPHFTPLPVQKPRKAMLLMDRGPSRPIVWLDREIMTPVLYEGEKPAASSNQPDAFASTDEVGDAQQQLGVSRAPLVVTVARAGHHFLAALDQRAPQFDARSRAIAQEVVDYGRWSQHCQERAIYGDY